VPLARPLQRQANLAGADYLLHSLRPFLLLATLLLNLTKQNLKRASPSSSDAKAERDGVAATVRRKGALLEAIRSGAITAEQARERWACRSRNLMPGNVISSATASTAYARPDCKCTGTRNGKPHEPRNSANLSG
jgi:hypothetical protein